MTRSAPPRSPRTSRRRTVAAGLLAASVTALSLAGAAGAAPAGPAWVATGTRALHLNGRPLGAAPAGQVLEVSVTLPLRNSTALHRLILAESTPGTPSYGHFLTPAQTLARFGPTAASAATVAGYLRASGLTGVAVSADRILVSGQATVAVAEHAFHTRLAEYALEGRTVYANIAPAEVPATLGTPVAAVLGLSDVPMNLPHTLAPSTPSRLAAIRRSQTQAAAHPGKGPTSPGNFAGFYPAAVQNMYDAATMPPASHESIAVITSGDMTSVIADLRYAEHNQGFPAVPVSVVYTTRPSEVVINNPYTGNLEWNLDTQISTMVAGSVQRLYIYDIPYLDDADVARGINMFVQQDRAMAGSVSVGECDFQPFLDGAMLTTDEMLAEGAVQGQSFFSSSGDNGYACPEVASTGVPGGVPGTSWPADGIYTTGVGGTTVFANNQGRVSNELAWIGGGGGVSNFEISPPWTAQENLVGEVAGFGEGGRGVPDVAADADNNVSPVLIYTGSKTGYLAVGGTSVASPLTMGLWARVQSVDGGRLGLASYDFYRVYNKVNPATPEGTALGITEYVPDPTPGPVSGFRDIIVGTNGVYTARPGYDYTTGLGSVQAAAFAGQLRPASRVSAKSR